MEFNHESKGDGVAPMSLYQGKKSVFMNRNGPRTAPPTEVECPLTYLVRECTTKSAPSRNGCCR